MCADSATVQLRIGGPELSRPNSSAIGTPALSRSFRHALRLQPGPLDSAQARAGSDHQPAPLNRPFRCPHTSAFASRSSAPDALAVASALGKIPGTNQHKAASGTYFHGPGHSSDIAGMGGADQHDSNIA